MEPESLNPLVHEKAVSNHADTREEIMPLVALCRAGKLFDVQAWIAEGKPVNPPLHFGKGSRTRSPLDIAMESGFHSLVEVLLRAGAIQDPPSGYGSPIGRALAERRLDMIELLMQHGCNARDVEFIDVLRSWDPKIFEFFIKRWSISNKFVGILLPEK
ncbi:MAG: ankyrin repeat domain-containing protein [Tepidisphaeraceae bacterium]